MAKACHRTHRERKENYIKALEEQVLDLRTKQREIVRENEALTSEVVHLRELVRNEGGTPEPFVQNENATWMMAAPSGGGGSDASAWGGGGGDMWQLAPSSMTAAEPWNWQGGSGAGLGTWGHTG